MWAIYILSLPSCISTLHFNASSFIYICRCTLAGCKSASAAGLVVSHPCTGQSERRGAITQNAGFDFSSVVVSGIQKHARLCACMQARSICNGRTHKSDPLPAAPQLKYARPRHECSHSGDNIRGIKAHRSERTHACSRQLRQHGAKQHTVSSGVQPTAPTNLKFIEIVWVWVDANLRLWSHCVAVEELEEKLR